ncbi:MAG TPA: hypothetical protein VLF90_02180 [Patescibacteria group bacterium]|nr:hypothetical protein [Patescibacteria group bacterium]
MVESLDSSITQQIMDTAPARCRGCENVFSKSATLARRVIDSVTAAQNARADQSVARFTLTDALLELEEDLSGKCPVGQISRSPSWGELRRECTYSTSLTEAESKSIGLLGGGGKS